MLVSIIIVNYNNLTDTIECLKSLDKVYGDFNIILVDNFSELAIYIDLQKFVESFSFIHNIEIVRTERNGGFAYGNNIGINKALEKNNCEYIMLLNNDTVVQKNLIEQLVDCFDEKTGISTPRIVFDSKRDYIWSDGGFFNNKFATGVNKNFLKKATSEQISECDFASFCCVMIKTDVIKNVGLLSEDYFMYFEDADYCKRVLLSGYRIKFTPNTVVFHKVSSASGGLRSPFYLEWCTRSNRIFIRKYYNSLFVKIRFVLKTFLKILYYILHFDFKRVKSIWKGLFL